MILKEGGSPLYLIVPVLGSPTTSYIAYLARSLQFAETSHLARSLQFSSQFTVRSPESPQDCSVLWIADHRRSRIADHRLQIF